MLVLGGLYRNDFNHGICRIIGLDEFEVFYDCDTYDDKWIFSGNFKKNVFFYRAQQNLFEKKSELVGFKELTETELQYFRPDLPMRFGRNKDASWNNPDATQEKMLQKEFGNITLNTDKIKLFPSGPGGGNKKSELIQGSPKLNVFEIIKIAKDLCKVHNSQPVSGIGFYRLGFQSGLPSYYMGGYVDKADIMANK